MRITESQIKAIEERGEVISQFDVYADASGVVISRNVSVGDFVSRGTVLFEIVNLSTVWVMLDAYESDLALLSKGDPITFTANALPTRQFSGKINFVDPVINPDTRTLTVRAEVANPGMVLKPEMFVNAKIQTKPMVAADALLIPKTAVLWTGRRSVVYVQRGDRTAPAFEMVEVNLGSRVGDQYQVLSGLEAGDQVVSNGVFAVDAAAQLRGNYSMMHRPEVKTLEVPAKFQEQLTHLLNAYYDLKDGLVETDPAKAKAQASKMKQALAKVDMGILDEKAHDTWMDLYGPIQKSIASIEQSTDIVNQRNSFQLLSDHLIDAVEYFGVKDDKVYKQFCPMAFGDKGAFWLSGKSEIRNPYFGDMMLKCGEVKEVYEKGKPSKVKGGVEERGRAVPQHHH